MKSRFLSVALLTTVLLISACGKDEGNAGTSNPKTNPATPTSPTNPNQPTNNNNCYCDECGCFILYSDGSYMDVDSCNSQPQQNYYPQQQYPQQNYYPQQQYPQQNYNPQQYYYPQNYYRPGYPQQNYGYPQQNYGYPQQGYGYPQQNYYPRY